MNSQTGPWLDVRAADLRAARGNMVTRKAFVRPILQRVPHRGIPTAIKSVCDKLRTTLFCLGMKDKSAVGAGVAGSVASRDENWRKKCRPHKNDAFTPNCFEHD